MTGSAVRLLKAAGALAVLLAVIVGVPALLLALQLVPHALPGPGQVLTVLRTRDNGQLAEVVLAAGVWICWALFTASTAAEIVALARVRPATRLPGLRVFQRPAAALVTAIAVGFTIAPLAVGGVTASGAAPPPLPVVPTVVTASPQPDAAALMTQDRPSAPLTAPLAAEDQPPPPPAANTTYQVRRRDTLWALAEHYLGDPLRYPEIVRLNRTAVGPDNKITVGTVLLMPPDAAGLPATEATPGPASTVQDVTVQAGDTLFGLTEEVTGSGGNWPQAWAVNRDRREPDGARFSDPSLIRPGWTLSIPTRAGVSAPAGTPTAPPTPPLPTPEPAPQPAPEPGSSSPAAPTSTDPGEPTTTAPAPTTAPTGTAAPVEPSPQAPGQASPDAAFDLPMAAFAGGGLLLAGLSLIALLRYRRRQFRLRRPGRAISGTPPELLPVERAVQTAGSAALPDVTWLDQALRSLIQTLGTVEGARLPDVIAACLTDDALTLLLTEPCPRAPSPWTVDAAGTRWTIRRGDPLPYDEQRRAYCFAPYPTLASVGSTADGEHWLLDLERAGAISVSGDGERALNLARFLAAELAHNTWSEMLQVTLVGFGEELTQINPDRLTCAEDVDQVITELGARLASVTEAMQAAGVDVLSGRLRDVVGDAWAPHVVLIAPHAARDNPRLRRLQTAIRERSARSAVALVLLDDPDDADTKQDTATQDTARWRLTLDDAGLLHLPDLGLNLIPRQIPAEEAEQLARMLALAAVTEDRPIPPAHGNKPWDTYADACGGLRIDPAGEQSSSNHSPGSTPAGDSPMGGPADTAPQGTDSVLPLSPRTYLDRAATTAEDLRALAPATDDRIRNRVTDADPTLDADLADWADPSCPRPKLTLLGPVEVCARGRLPEHNPRRRFYTEVVAYLATRPTGATSEQYATAIWPDDPDIAGKTKGRQALSTVRAWLGTDPVTGTDYLPSGLTTAGAARYTIEGILVDAELFRRLRLRGLARGPAGIPDLRAALDLVTGRPFDLPAPRRGAPGGYSWLTEENSRLDHDYAAMIVDVAHTVATHHLTAGEPELAAAAARVALTAGSYEDVPLLDLVAACDAQGNRAEADAYVARILTNHDAEVEEDLPPRTADILFRRQWTDRTR